MAMYYYASKLSSIACGARCKHTVGQQRNHGRDRNKGRHKSKANDDDSEDETDAKVTNYNLIYFYFLAPIQNFC